jgi:hypothetical protein
VVLSSPSGTGRYPAIRGTNAAGQVKATPR